MSKRRKKALFLSPTLFALPSLTPCLHSLHSQLTFTRHYSVHSVYCAFSLHLQPCQHITLQRQTPPPVEVSTDKVSLTVIAG
ncbi:MAG: hypothetical protein J3R72DRAFT_460632 [Linnemannia gamsii]|nr:MAG: hypothetical protein J3R72DRAFT_460632 [Linnemannia gamsii]